MLLILKTAVKPFLSCQRRLASRAFQQNHANALPTFWVSRNSFIWLLYKKYWMPAFAGMTAQTITAVLKLIATLRKKWSLILVGLLCCSMAAQAGLLKDELKIKETPDPLEFDTEQLYDDVKAGVDADNIRGFQSGECIVLIEILGIPIPFPIPINHITMHVPDLLVNVAGQPFTYLWKDEAKIPQEELFKALHNIMYPIPTSGGVLGTKHGGPSYTRFKDVEIYGNPPIVPPLFGTKAKLFPKLKFKGFKLVKEDPQGFYSLARKKFPVMRFGCITSFPPYVHVFNSEIDYFWRQDVPYLDMILKLAPRTVGPGWIPIAGGLIPGQEVISTLFPLKGTVTNPIHAHGALVTALRAAYISTSNPFPDLALLTLHPSQFPSSYLQTCISHECKTFTSEESKWGEDKVGTWQLVAPKPKIVPPPLDAMAFPLDSKTYIDYLRLVDTLVPPKSPPSPVTNPGEKYSFLHWRCHKCCDIPRGIKGLVSIETVSVIEWFDSCESPFPNLDPITSFEGVLKKELEAYQKKLKLEGGGE